MAQTLDAKTEVELQAAAAGDVRLVKTPSTRLLDIVAGWSAFVQNEEDSISDRAVSVDDLTALYQEVGQFAFDASDAGPEEEARQVRAFVEDRILPLILKTA